MISIAVKPVQIALLVVGMGFVAYFTKEYHDSLTYGHPQIDPYDVGGLGRYEFFLYTTGVGVGIAVFGLLFVLMGLMEKKHGALAISAVQAIWTLQLLVSTGLVTKILTTYQKEIEVRYIKITQCEVWDKEKNRDYHHTCDQLIVGVAGGFAATAAFGVDTFISLVSHIQSLQYSRM